MECKIYNLYHHIIHVSICFFVLFGIDVTMWFFKFNNYRWYKLHVIANIIACIYSYHDFFNVLQDPLNKYIQDVSVVPPAISLALHLYHMLMFYNLVIIDWVHHIVMMSILMLSYICPNPSLVNYSIFVLNGLPGGIDYSLLIMVKYNIISKLLEKRINSKLNIWIRGPGILISAYIVYIQWKYSIIRYSAFLVAIVITGLYWNAQYFTERVVYNWGYSSKN